jgi:hypothetical protein
MKLTLTVESTPISNGLQISTTPQVVRISNLIAHPASIDIPQPLATTDSPEFADVKITTLAADSILGTVAKSVLGFVSGLWLYLQTVWTDLKDPTGFIDGDNIEVTYDHVARTITLTHASGYIDYLWRGKKKRLTSPWTSAAHPATASRYFLTSSDGTTATWSEAAWTFWHLMFSVAVKDEGTGDFFALSEAHGTMPHQAHESAHNLLGTYRTSGLGPTIGSYAENTASDAATTPGFDAGVIKDEDNSTSIAATSDGSYTTFRIGAAGVPVFDTTATFPFRSSGSYPLINNPTTGAETATIQNRYFNVYELLIPTAKGTNSQKYRRVLVQPQAAYTTLSAAQAESTRSINLGSLSSPEFCFYSRITYVTSAGDANTGKCRIAPGGVSYVLGSRAGQVTVSGGAAQTAENVPFTPDANFTTSPASVDAALKELASRITALEP